jgi:hypothetical protein
MVIKASPSIDFFASMDRPSRSTETFAVLDKQVKTIQTLIEKDVRFGPFVDLSPTLLFFLSSEKLRLNRIPETKLAIDSQGLAVTGFVHEYSPLPEPYDASSLQPFLVKGLWICPSEGNLFYEDQEHLHPVVKDFSGTKRVLFLIHPLSEHLYAPLIDKYKDSQENFQALALSSLRSLLVALPIIGGFRHIIAKVSLDFTSSGTLRHLTKKETYVSVVNSTLLEQASFNILKEQVAFTPLPTLLHPEAEQAQRLGAGMIYRFLPKTFLQPSSCDALIPFFSILGENNKDLLKALIKDSKLNPETFILERLLTPLAQKIAFSIFVQKTSFELHGQNLLLLLQENQGHIELNFMYRDLGGVNRFPRKSDSFLLPQNLTQEHLSWAENHVHDTATALEAFIEKIVFSLTKTVFNDPELFGTSPCFCLWRQKMLEQCLEINWQIIDAEGHHQTKIELPYFCRYGFFEKYFGQFLIGEISKYLPDKEQERLQVFSQALEPLQEAFSLCHNILWFEQLIHTFYKPT